MDIEWNAFTPGAARIGGALIGVATIDKRLVLGSTMFGVGWGLAGFCPGPGIVAMSVATAPRSVVSPDMTVRVPASGLAEMTIS